MDAIKPCPADPKVYWDSSYVPPCCQDYSTTGDISYLGITSPSYHHYPAYTPLGTDLVFKLANELEISRLRKKLYEITKEAMNMNEEKFDPVEDHQKVIDELHELYSRKNHDYGDSFHKTYLEEGLAMCRIRLMDKMERFKRLSRQYDHRKYVAELGEYSGKVGDESLRDTLMDLANYALMSVMELDREKAKREEKTNPNAIKIKHLD